MNQVTMHKSELKKILEKNRDTHRELFEEAWEEYGKKVIWNLESRLRAAKEDSPQQVSLHFNLVMPQDHTEDYDQAISMLEHEVYDEVVLDNHEYAELVLDNWGWKGQFSSSYYSNTGKVL